MSIRSAAAYASADSATAAGTERVSVARTWSRISAIRRQQQPSQLRCTSARCASRVSSSQLRVLHTARNFMLCFFVPLAAADGLAVASLAVEHLIAPDGVDVTAPRFSWHLVPPAGARGVVPLASQLQVYRGVASLVMNGRGSRERRQHALCADRSARLSVIAAILLASRANVRSSRMFVRRLRAAAAAAASNGCESDAGAGTRCGSARPLDIPGARTQLREATRCLGRLARGAAAFRWQRLRHRRRSRL